MVDSLTSEAEVQRLEELERQQTELRKAIQLQKAKNEELLQLLGGTDRELEKRLFLGIYDLRDTLIKITIQYIVCYILL